MDICIDFDGTIVDHAYPMVGSPNPKAIEYIKEFIEHGANIILFTMRSDEQLRDAVKYLKNNGISLYGVNYNPSQRSWTTSPKAYGELYIDDAAFGCPMIEFKGFYRKCVDWSKVGPAVLQTLKDQEQYKIQQQEKEV